MNHNEKVNKKNNTKDKHVRGVITAIGSQEFLCNNIKWTPNPKFTSIEAFFTFKRTFSPLIELKNN